MLGTEPPIPPVQILTIKFKGSDGFESVIQDLVGSSAKSPIDKQGFHGASCPISISIVNIFFFVYIVNNNLKI